VRPSSITGALACLALSMLFALGPRPARAEWEVRRTSSRATAEQAARALRERPTDEALARRLVGLVGKSGASELKARFQARADAADATYADVAAHATLLLALGEPEAAAAAFARASALRAEPGVLGGRARALARAGHPTEALEAYDEALRHETAPRARRRLLEEELALLEAGADPERELRLRRALADADPRSEEAAARVADVLERLGRAGEAADLLEARLQRAGVERRFELALRVAELRDAAGDGERAARTLADLLRSLPRGDEDRRRLAWSRAVTVARHRDALSELAKELARAPGPVEWDVLGQVRDELGDLEGALEAERRAASARPGADVGRRLVALLDRLGRDDEAVAVYEELARREPGDPRWPLELIERELRRGQRARAGTHFDRAAARFARSPAAMSQLAELASRWGETARALAAWERVRKLAPRDEQGILGLGELQFTTGKRALALRTWQALRAREGSPAEGHLRLAEVLLEHDLLDEALAEVQEARTLDSKHTRAHRLLAQILERQRKPDAAVREWESVLELARGADRAGERREARARILTIVARQSRAKLDERVRALEEAARRAPDDREAALFLAEAQQRVGNRNGAIATLRAVVERDAKTHEGGDADAELTLALVRLLRASGQTEEAVRRLEELAARAPARAREAHVQIADVELARHDEAVALQHAEEAARLAPGDGQALARIASIQERAGDEALALETYRRAFERDANPTAGFALARLDERRGDVAAAAAVLRRILETAGDDEAILEAGRRAIDVEEYLGRLPELAQLVARGLSSGPRAPIVRRVFVDVLRRLLPPLYRADPGDAGAAADRARLARHGLRPLLDQVADAEGQPDAGLIELLGMLGNRDATPVLARLAAPATDQPREAGASALASPLARETQLAAVVALGRLGDERGRDVLEKLAGAPDASLREAAVWALGRVGVASPTLAAALRDGRAAVAGLACLGIGRTRSRRAVTSLASIATDVERPVDVRRAAIAGLALSGDASAVPTLLALADSGDDALERGALVALGALRDRRALPTLLGRALFGRGPAAEGGVLLAMDLWASGAPLPDEATAVDGARVGLVAALAGLTPRWTGADRTSLWRNDPRTIRDLLASALATPGEPRARALTALDARDDGPGLGSLLEASAEPLPQATAAALNDVGGGAREALASLLDDADPETRAAALRVLAKLGDARVTPARVARAAAGPGATREAALFVTRRWAAAGAPTLAPLAESLGASLTAAGASWETRLGLVETLAAVGDPGVPALEHALDDPNALVRAAAADGLARAPRATTALVTAAADPAAGVRAAVARALQGRPGAPARAALDRLARDGSPLVRREATAPTASAP
jgi:tetratricopeptide (TPR) repeat protein/HEAT repeat protein